MIRYLSILVLGILTGCANQSILSNSSGGCVGTYRLPPGWEREELDKPSRAENMISRIGQLCPGISINAYRRFDESYPKTQQGCAESYLDGVRDAYDDEIEMETQGAVPNRWHGQILLYRYYSDWYGDHLVAMIVTGGGFATAELWARTEEEREKNTEVFQQVVGSINLSKL